MSDEPIVDARNDMTAVFEWFWPQPQPNASPFYEWVIYLLHLLCMFFLNLLVTIVESPLRDIAIYLLGLESLTLGRSSFLFPSDVSYLNHVVHVKEKDCTVFTLLQKSDHFILPLRKGFSILEEFKEYSS